MKSTLHGFNQEESVKFRLTNDELALLRWFIDFKETGSMDKEYDAKENCLYYWISYKKIIEDMPILVIGSEKLEAQKKKIQRLLTGSLKQILKRKVKKSSNGTFLFLAVNEENYKLLLSKNSTGQKCPTGWTKMSNRDGQKCPNKDISINNNINIINNIYIYWNEQKIIVHKELTNDLKRAIDQILKKFTEEEIIKAIQMYKEVLESKYYFNYKWSLKDFLTRKNGISTFMEDGSNYVNYKDWKEKEKKYDRNTGGVSGGIKKSSDANKPGENRAVELTPEERAAAEQLK